MTSVKRGIIAGEDVDVGAGADAGSGAGVGAGADADSDAAVDAGAGADALVAADAGAADGNPAGPTGHGNPWDCCTDPCSKCCRSLAAARRFRERDRTDWCWWEELGIAVEAPSKYGWRSSRHSCRPRSSRG